MPAMTDSSHSTVAERSGPSYSRKAFCGTDNCPEQFKEKVVWAVKMGTGLLQIPRVYCESCLREVVIGPWND